MLGVGIDLAKRVFEPKGIRIDYKTMEWDAALKETREGKHDAVVGAFVTDAPDFVYPKEPVGAIFSVVYVKKGDPWRFAGVGSLAGRKVGVIEAYTYGEPFDAYLAGNKSVTWVKGDDALNILVKKLLDGSIDTLIEDRAVFQLRSRQLYVADKFAEAGHGPKEMPIYLTFSPKKADSARYAKLFTEGVAELRKSGELKAILHKYGMKDWK
jgi:polar amino acid transport system substrate-binding protein